MEDNRRACVFSPDSDNDLLILCNRETKVVFLNCFAADNALLMRDPA